MLRFAFFIDLLGITLLFAASHATWRGRRGAPALLTAAWAWTSANFWRATMDRYAAIERADAQLFSRGELWLGPLLTTFSILMLTASLWLALRSREPGAAHSV